MKALVTGGAGFIGSNLVDALLARGDAVVVFDDLSTGRRSNLAAAEAAGAEFVAGSITSRDELDALLAQQAPDAIFHLAAQVDVRRSVADPAFDAAVNVLGTLNVLEAAQAAGGIPVVFSSTGGAIYGDTPGEDLPVDEHYPARPMAPYGQSKLAAEGFAEHFARERGQAVSILRYANVYGPRQDPLGEGGVAAIFCKNAVRGERPTIFGDGRQTRDFVHVDDVVAANLAALERGLLGPFNIGTGKETSVLQLAEALAPLAAGDFTPQFEPRRAGEVERSALDITRAREELGWQAEIAMPQSLPALLGSVREDLGSN